MRFIIKVMKREIRTILPIHPKAKRKVQVEVQVEAQVELTKTQVSILSFCANEVVSKMDIAKHLGQSGPSGSLKKAMNVLINQNLLEYTIPDKPQSSKQKYRTTEKGSAFLKEKN